MKKNLTIFLQIIVVLMGVAALFFLLYMPTIEGRNVDSTFFEIYFKDSFLAFAYLASIPVFVGIYKVVKVLGYAGQDMLSTEPAQKALRTIKNCALVNIGSVAIGEIFILSQPSDDRAGGIAVGVYIIVGSVVVAAIASLIAKKFKRNLTA